MNTLRPYDIYVGIDVDKRSYSFTASDSYNMIQSKTLSAQPEQFLSYMKKKYPNKEILFAYEAGGTGYHLYDYLKSQNCNCVIVSPASIPKPLNARVKTNRIDSQQLVHYIQRGYFKSIRVPEGPYRALRHLVKIQESYTTKRKQARQRIKALLLFENLSFYIKEPEKSWSKRYIEILKTQIPCSKAVKIHLDRLLKDLEYACDGLLSIYREIKKFVKSDEEINYYIGYLMSIPGIGFITATNILGKIGDPKNLKDIRELASFIGVIPSEHSTGEKINRGPITHLGDKSLRRLLIEASWIAIRQDAELNQFFYRILNRNHPKGATQKAIVAVARKLTHRIYKVLKEQRNYVIH